MAERYSRRGVLKLFWKTSTGLTAIGIDAYLSHIRGFVTPLTPFWERLETGTLLKPQFVKEVEGQFGISIFEPLDRIPITNPNLKKTLGEKTVIALGQRYQEAILCNWDKPRTALLAEVLSQLSASFYTSTQGKVRFVLLEGESLSRRQPGESDNLGTMCICNQNRGVWDSLTNSVVDDNSPPTVIFVKRDLRALWPIDRQRAQQNYVHELTHQRTLSGRNLAHGRNITIDQALESIGVPKTSDYYLPDPNLVGIFKRHLDENGNPMENDLMGTNIIPAEFIAVAAESYFEGYKQLTKTYQTDLDQTAIDNLYTFMYDRVFEGREYQNGKGLPPHP